MGTRESNTAPRIKRPDFVGAIQGNDVQVVVTGTVSQEAPCQATQRHTYETRPQSGDPSHLTEAKVAKMTSAVLLVAITSLIDREDLIVAQGIDLVMVQETGMGDGRAMVEDLQQSVVLVSDGGIV
ncbi:MAG: hypothetical protein Q9174_002006 [Haloplaca sp. 1 TL-2023]